MGDIPITEELTDPFVECAFTVGMSYQLYNVSDGTTIVAELKQIQKFTDTRPKAVLLFYAGRRVTEVEYVEGEGFSINPRIGFELRHIFTLYRIFKESSEYEPGTMKGGSRRRSRRRHRSRRGKTRAHRRRR